MSTRIVVLVAAITLGVSQLGFGQETPAQFPDASSIRRDSRFPARRSLSTGAQGTKQTVTDGRATFTVPFLTPGTYAVRIELTGFKPVAREGVVVRLGQTVDIPATLIVGELSESVEVRASTPDTINTRSTTTGANISSDQLQNIPVGRNVSQTLYLAPGVTSSGSAGVNNPSISGGSGLDNQYVIDASTSPLRVRRARSYSSVFGSLGTPRRSTSSRKCR
jgi:hypothetical protein